MSGPVSGFGADFERLRSEKLRAEMQNQTAPRYLKVLSDYVSETRLEDLPGEVIERGRWVIADCLLLIAAGMQAAQMRDFARRQLASDPKGEASVIGYGRKTAPNVAVLLNGTAGTWLEMVEENIYAKGLPAIQVVPAALAMAEQHRASVTNQGVVGSNPAERARIQGLGISKPSPFCFCRTFCPQDQPFTTRRIVRVPVPSRIRLASPMRRPMSPLA